MALCHSHNPTPLKAIRQHNLNASSDNYSIVFQKESITTIYKLQIYIRSQMVMAIGNCIHCHSPATEKCSGCSEAPGYGNSLPVPAFYCSFGCQKSDWGRHRTECRNLQARKSLSRAAFLLQSILYKIKLQATTLDITSVQVEGTTVYLTGPLPSPLCAQQLKPFPAHLFEDQAILESALVYTACMEGMVFLNDYTAKLLQGQNPLC